VALFASSGSFLLDLLSLERMFNFALVAERERKTQTARNGLGSAAGQSKEQSKMAEGRLLLAQSDQL